MPTSPAAASPQLAARLVPTPERFLRDGQPHVIISGALHYFRVHPELWRDRLRRLVAMGCDSVETYVAWNLHQPQRGVTTFDGIADLGRFLDLAGEEGLDVIVRPGPYICAEWEAGGISAWVLADRGMHLRSRDPRWLDPVDAWFDQLIPIIAARQACHGGPVVMVQVENEYGSYGDDTQYLEHVRDGLRRRGITELLVTSDGPARMWLSGGTVEGALATLNFGSRTEQVLEMAAQELPDQPQMCMEFWNGWFDHWGEEHHTRSADSAAAELETMLSRGMSVNFYMAHGGSNFALWAGANHDGVLQPTTTSYDYDAPIAEDGTLTPKFHAFREVISRHRDLPPLAEHLQQLGLTEHPAALPAGEVTVERRVPLRRTSLWTAPGPVHPVPPSFEEADLDRGLQLLRRRVEIEAAERDGELVLDPLRLYGLRDLAQVYVDGYLAGAVGHGHEDPARIDLTPLAPVVLPDGARRAEVTVEILVESLARVNFGPHLGDAKGICGGVWHRVRYLNDWETHCWRLPGMAPQLTALLEDDASMRADGPDPMVADGPADGPDLTLPLLVGASFTVDDPADAHLDMSGAGRGVAWVNGFCLGRYWSVGPQRTLYIPAPVLHPGRNQVLLLEMEESSPRLALVGGPVLD
ncbi:beta-galactosidase [Brachybacterium sp. EF45031]|uniref:glycoside hydrolase family 35 protein n=1 Tax=Brachybacterium sillae TaxID=2810536 RepID=UPI00217DA03F|nr:beta-galactosidase family protein [Brachybacterium sillae]MCS6711671.1 beta-galactosidase [Brachybacterium sillae]